MRRFLFFKPTSKHLVLCFIFGLFWVVTHCATTLKPNTMTQSTGVQSSTLREATTATTATTERTTTTTKPPPPPDVSKVTPVTQNETSITLSWDAVNNIKTYKLKYDQGKEKNITGAHGTRVIEAVVSDLRDGTEYSFTLFTLSNGLSSFGYNFTAVTAPRNPKDFSSAGQNETSITLTWTKVVGIDKYTLICGAKNISINISKELETYTVPNLQSATEYNFSLFAVFKYARSSGATITAVTAPRNPAAFRPAGQNETSITLTWEKVVGIDKYTLTCGAQNTSINISKELETYTFSNLLNATEYNFSLFAVFKYARSSGATITAVTAPRNPAEFRPAGQNETSITLMWEKVVGIDKYTLICGAKNTSINISKELETYTVPILQSATEYSFSLFAVFKYARSSGATITAVTAPRNPAAFRPAGQNETSITLTWEKVVGIDKYTLIYGEKKTSINISKELETYTVSNLEKGAKYSFSLFAVFEYAESSEATITAATAPPMVSSVSVTERFLTSATLNWENPVKSWSYILETNGANTSIGPDSSANTLSHTVRKLKAGTLYSFNVTTLFFNLTSTAYSDSIVTKIDCDKIEWHVTNSSIEGTVDGLFSAATASNSTQGRVISKGRNVAFNGLYPGATYEISLVYETHNSTLTQCVRNPSVTIIPPLLNGFCKNWASGYSALIVWDPPNGVTTKVRINVDDQSDLVDIKANQHIINGLQPAKTYKVSLVSLSGERHSQPSVFYCATDNRGVIAGSVIGVLLFIVLVCVAVFILLKRPDYIRKMPLIAGSKKPTTKAKAISVAKFPAHFHQLSLDDNRGFSQEYEDLSPVGTDQTHKAAVLPENKVKNRFTNILPYDWCRVKLSTSSPSDTLDYINASYMPGYNRNREYIASQGPLPSTVKDFWQMIWEQKVKRVVMVTNCVEAGRTKCEQYWPEDQSPRLYGEMLVTLTSEQKEPNWTLREFRVKNRNNSEERTVKHFHFTAWPDHGVPQGTEVLIQFRALVRRHIEREGTGEPTVVHCSAGVGRTGTIIALDVLLQQLGKERAVGINDFVHRMRQHRSHMVQTESQYVFLHQCIMDSLKPAEKQEENIYENADMIYANATALQEFHNHNT